MASDKIENGIYFIQNTGAGTVLTLDGGSASDDTKVQGNAKYELSEAWVAAQLWIITEIDNSDVYFIQNLNSRTYLTIKGDSSTGGTPIVGHQRTGTCGQRWKFRRTANRMSYVISNETTKNVVDLYAGNTADGTAVNAYWFSVKNNNQVWQVVRA